jgi:multicomponent Na+:H+ antiporter subunit E
VSRLAGHGGLVAWLTVVWVGLWGEVSWANVLGGLVVAVALVAALPLPAAARQGTVRPLALLQLLGVFAWELVSSSAVVTAQVLCPRGQLRSAVLAVPVAGLSDRLVTVLANAVSLTPGTLSLEVDRPSSTLYVHVLNVPSGPDALDGPRRSIARLQRLVVRALGTPADRASSAGAR